MSFRDLLAQDLQILLFSSITHSIIKVSKTHDIFPFYHYHEPLQYKKIFNEY